MKTKLFLIGSLMIVFWLSMNSCGKDDDTGRRVDTAMLNQAYDSAAHMSCMKSLVVWYKGDVLKEGYFGAGGADSLHDVCSVTKSVTALLIGIAIEKGYIDSIDQKISEFLTPVVDSFPADKQNITIRHLLTMSSGLQGDELYNMMEYIYWQYAPNQTEASLGLPVEFTPGTHFNYRGAVYHLLSVILTRATGMTTKEFADQYLFIPLGIESPTWPVDQQGYYYGASGLQITPLDMIKIGELILNHGKYNNSRIVSSGWIDYLNDPMMDIHNSIPLVSGYSFGWWVGQTHGYDFVMAYGWGGQFIVVFPELDLVVVETNEWATLATMEAERAQFNCTLNLIMDGVVTAFE